MKSALALFLAVLLVLLAGCGLKGPLYMPETVTKTVPPSQSAPTDERAPTAP